MKLTTSKGGTLILEDQIGSGGQGEVYSIVGSPNTVAKIFYHENSKKLAKAKQLESRIAFMIKYSPIKHSSQSIKDTLVWPNEVLYRNGHFVGFTMQKAGDPRLNEHPTELRSLCKSDLDRYIKNNKDWAHFHRSHANATNTRLKICYNIANAVHALHQAKSYVLTDFKPENILVSSSGWISIIDLDSIQITNNGKLLFPAEAVTNEYIPPEWLQNQTALLTSAKLETWDRFCFAILAYQLLLGIHPFNASHKKFTEQSEFIREGLFANGSRQNEFITISPPHKNFHSLPQEIQNLFLRCFENGHQDPQHRPPLKEWADTIISILYKPPKILWFKADKVVRTDHQPIQLSWSLEHADRVYINNRAVQVNGDLEVTPTKDTVYELKVVNGKKSTTKQLTVQIDRKPPEVVSFQTDKTMLADHQPATLTWRVKRAHSVSINRIGDVTKKKSYKVSPKTDTEYILTIRGFFGHVVTKKIKIRTSKDAPKIKFFTSSIQYRTDNSPVYLKWDIDKAYNIHIDPIGDVSKLNSIRIDPRKDTIYQLKATSYFGVEASSKIRLTVSKKPPVIEVFDANPKFLDSHVPVRLSWSTQNASSLRLVPGGNVTGQTSCQVKPTKDTKYTLKAKSYFGVQAQAHIEIKTSKEPPSIRFEYHRISSSSGRKKIKLIWRVDRASHISIDQGIGQVIAQGKTELKLEEDTSFTMTAVSPFGINTSKTLNVKVIQKPSYKKVSKSRKRQGIKRGNKLDFSKRKLNK